MPRLPPSPNLAFDACGLIRGEDFSDCYFSRDDGLAESRAVFLAGNHLPGTWQNAHCFVIAELGFGTGLNVLAAWDLWNKTASPGAILHIISVEGFLMEASDAAKALQHWPELAALSQKLLGRWPSRSAGMQRVWFPENNVCISFLIGPCEDMLARADFKADCWFLDGFASSRNPDMWSRGVFAQVARLSKPGTTLATYSVSGQVRAGLSGVGFDVTRQPGFGSKRQRLEASFGQAEPCQPPARPNSALVIGGGIGGAAMCEALARRGIGTDIFDADPCGRTKASGNPLALIIPRLDKGDTFEARFYRSAYLMAIDRYTQMGPDCFHQTGVLEGGEDDAARARLAEILDDPPLPASHLHGGAHGTLHHKSAGIAYPDAVLAQLRASATAHPIAIGRVEKQGADWCVFDHQGELIAKADICVIATGNAISGFYDFGPDMGARAGQLSWAPMTGRLPDIPISGAGYGAAFGDRLVFGATYEHWQLEALAPPPVTPEGHTHNCAVLRKIAPDIAARIDVAQASGRTSVRVITSDQMPIAGPVPDAPSGLFAMSGLGSRGFTTAFLCADMIASQICNEPAPTEAGIVRALAPDRFIKRRAKRAKK
jgi:tRNA 5-methylaminomethyl-2-thiouridine biosynthesis bifunctional protein